MQVVNQTLNLLSTKQGRQGYAVLDLDVALFCSTSKATNADKIAAVDALVEQFCQ